MPLPTGDRKPRLEVILGKSPDIFAIDMYLPPKAPGAMPSGAVFLHAMAIHQDRSRSTKDWPQLNFIMYHAAHRPFLQAPDQALVDFEKTGRIQWVSELAEIPAKFGVNNVYGELDTTFANSAVTHPRYCAALLGTLIKGLGADHVVWGTDSVWYGSPQWQIEALRRIEIPEDMQKKYGFTPLGAADGMVKSAIFGYNSARLYGLSLRAKHKPLPAHYQDKLARLRAEYELAGLARSNAAYGFIRKRA